MYERKESHGNSYFPTFLYCNVSTNETLRFLMERPLSEETEAAFFHEYIHYLQDVTTMSGYVSIEVVVDQMKYIYYLANKRKKAILPIDLGNVRQFNLMPNKVDYIVNRGDYKKQINGADCTITEVIDFSLKATTCFLNPRVPHQVSVNAVLTFKDSKGNLLEYNVGDYAISESMAYMMENYLYKEVLQPPPDCPYRVVEKVVDTLYPFIDTIDQKVALCDVALMHPFPGYALYNILEKMKNTKSKVSVASIYLIGLSQDITRKSGIKSYWSAFEQTNKTSLKQLCDYFVIPQYWQKEIDALSVVFRNAFLLRYKRMPFMIDILNGGKLFINRPLKKILKGYLGMFCVRTADDTLYSLKPFLICNENLTVSVNFYNELHDELCRLCEVEPDMFDCLQQIYSLFYKNNAIKRTRLGNILSMKCDLIDFCKQSSIHKKMTDVTNENCYNEPWNNTCSPIVESCPFGRLSTIFHIDKMKMRAKQ